MDNFDDYETILRRTDEVAEFLSEVSGSRCTRWLLLTQHADEYHLYSTKSSSS